MKNFVLSMCMVALSTMGFGQIDTLYAKPNYSHTLTVWDSPNLTTSTSVGYIKHEDGVVVYTDKLYGENIQYYMLSDSSGYVSTSNGFVQEKPDYNYRPNTKESLGWVSEPQDPCKRAEYHRNLYISSGSMVDLDNFRKWTSVCFDKEY